MLLIAGGGDSSDDVTDLDKELSAVKWVNFDTLEVHVTCIVCCNSTCNMYCDYYLQEVFVETYPN